MKKYIAGFVGLLVFLVVMGSFTVVSSQERAVVTRLGKINRTLEDGLHFKVPFIESVNKIDVSIQALEISEAAYSKDAQTVQAAITVNYQLDKLAVADLFREVRYEWEPRLIVPAIKESIKATTAKYTAQGLIDSRSQVKDDIRKILTDRLANQKIVVTEVSITNFDFDDAYEAAIRNKQVEEQNALKQVNVTKQEEEKKKQEILKAEALSEKTRLEVVALQASQGKQIIEKIYAEAALEAAKKWNGQLPQQMVPGGALPFINLTK